MNWHEEMLARAAEIAFGSNPPEHDEVRVESDFFDGYDPTYGQGDPRFRIEVTLRRDGMYVTGREYTGSEVDDFLKPLLAPPSN